MGQFSQKQEALSALNFKKVVVHSQRLRLCCRQQLRTKDWRKALIGDRWFTEGGFIVGGRPNKDLSWFRELRKPFWWVCTKGFH